MLLSPAKTQNFEPETILQPTSQPRFTTESYELVKTLRSYSKGELQELMSISPELAGLNQERFKNYKKTLDSSPAKAALYAFEGDVYKSLDKKNYSAEQLAYAQDHLRILSGLYGLLRPLDLIQPYRLEMKTALSTEVGKNLYQFWGDKITQLLAKDLGSDRPVINLASKEYSKAVNLKSLPNPVVDLQFKEYKNGKLRTVAIFAKQARGAMANYAIVNTIQQAEELKLFNQDGYEYSSSESTAKEWVFVR